MIDPHFYLRYDEDKSVILHITFDNREEAKKYFDQLRKTKKGDLMTIKVLGWDPLQ